ncbi:MAG TPA: ParB/RepB/Spo0J family partition protein [Bacteroidia bacterium]|nr:ParB/RepB/Spo0J family partition protein [Bacteroidia bacterium]
MTDPKNKRRNALGRGLSALLTDSENPELESGPVVNEATATTDSSVSEIPIQSIETNPYQPRTHFDLVALEELSLSIKAQGIIQPITVRKMGTGSYQLISGERRLQASKMAGFETIPAYVRTADDEQMLEMALIENIQRQDLNPMEIALAYHRLVEELNLRLEDLGDKVGKKRATVNNYMRLLKLPPEIQIGLKEAKLSMGHARALINIETIEDQLAVYKAILENDLSVRKVEEMVRAIAERGSKKPSAKPSSQKDIHVQKLERRLEDKFGSRVVISQSTQGKGELKIGFESIEDLNRILEILEA